MIIDGWDHIVPLGSIIKTHGFDGAFVVSIPDDAELNAEKIKTIFIETGPFPVPFAVKSARDKGDSLLITLTLAPSIEDARRWVGSNVFIAADLLTQTKPGAAEFDITGYVIIDKASAYTGTIESVFEHAGQWMMELQPGEKWVPLAEEYILSIDEDKKQVEVNLPEGLLDI